MKTLLKVRHAAVLRSARRFAAMLLLVAPAAHGQSITATDTFFVAQVPLQAEHGLLSVPESRANPDRRTIELGYFRFRSLSPDPGPPTFWLAGGPGVSGAADIRNAGHILMPLLALGDVVVLDQRGTRGSSSNLDCPERWERPTDRPGSWALILSGMRAAMERCVEEYAAQGVDLTAYNTTENADDVDALRRALGYDGINLFGTSYGTHLGIELLRRHGAAVERAVLAAFYWELQRPEAEAERSLEAALRPIVELMLADTAARRRLPDPMGTVDRLLAELERRPALVERTRGDSADTTRIVIGRFDAEMALAGGLSFRTNATRWLMRTLADAANGDLTRLAEAVSAGGRLNLMATAVGCAEGLHGGPEYGELCGLVPHADRAPEFQAFFQSDVPVLFVAGTLDFDPAVLDAWRPYLPASEVLILENGFHDDYYWYWSLYGDHVLGFLRGGSVDGQRVTLPLEFQF